MLYPWGAYEDGTYLEGDNCPSCSEGIITITYDGELVCNMCGMVLDEPKTPLIDKESYAPVNQFTGNPEGTVGTPVMDLRSTKDGRIKGAVWLENQMKKIKHKHRKIR